MTTTSWTTSTDIPPNAWAAVVADVTRLLGVVKSGGSTVTAPDGTPDPILTSERVGFTVTAPPAPDGTPSPPLTVEFTRVAGTGSAATEAPSTSGLVLAAIDRAAKHWGPLVKVTTDADTTARAVARAVGDALFGPEDRALAGQTAPQPFGQLWETAAAAHSRAAAAAPVGADLPTMLRGLIAELTAELNGMTIAAQLLTPPAPGPTPAP